MCTHDPVEQQIALKPFRTPVEVKQVRLHPQFTRCRTGNPGMVGLQPAEGDHLMHPASLRLRYQVFQFARFVATQPWTYTIVTLDVYCAP
jgi:hypothetical protein